MSDKYIGKLLDNRYEILQVIGTGGMAVVYKALCHRLNRHVAIKILKDEYAKDEEFRSRFRAESHAVAMLSHPNIVSVYDVSKSNSTEYIVMELIDGMTLKEYMQRRGSLTQKEAVHFVSQILKALSHAHSKGIIHRDIKPHNIMLLRDSTIKVADFGIARFESSQKTVTREAFGSVHYIAPEQAKGSHIDCRADIYSTGVVLYEMLTGRLPYEGDTPVSVAIQHINSLPLSPREINSEIPEALEKITMKAMAPSLAKRYASTDEMLKDIEEYRKNPSVYIEYEPPVKLSDADDESTKKVSLVDDDEFEEEEQEEEKGILTKLPSIAAIAAGIIFLIGVLTLLSAIFGWGDKKPQQDLITPYILGMTIEEATEKYADFEIIETNEDLREYSDEYDEDEIMKQIPREGEENKNGKIRVTISKGKNSDEIVLEDITGHSLEQAKMVLDRAGLIYKVVEEKSEEIEKGSVIKTDPSEGATLYSGDSVTVYVSLGKDEEEKKDTVVPYIVGLSETQAIDALAAASLQKGEVKSASSDTVKKGYVISQDVNSGDKAKVDSEIGFTISTGPEKREEKPVQKPQTDDKPATEKPTTDKKEEEKKEEPAANDGMVEITRSIRLPSDIETFKVRITVNGESQYEKEHKGTDGSVNVTLHGKGESTVCVYINDVLRQEIPIDFK